jgi:hypothetical protein
VPSGVSGCYQYTSSELGSALDFLPPSADARSTLRTSDFLQANPFLIPAASKLFLRPLAYTVH